MRAEGVTMERRPHSTYRRRGARRFDSSRGIATLGTWLSRSDRRTDQTPGVDPPAHRSPPESRGGLFRARDTKTYRGGSMAIHLTPEELSDALGMDSREIVRLCREES